MNISSIRGFRGFRDAQGNVYGDKPSTADVYTTLLVRSSSWTEQRGFSYSQGDYIPGVNVVATQAETNMLVSCELGQPHVWAGLEWGIPLFAPERFQTTSGTGNYPVTPGDITEFVTKALICLYCGSNNKPFIMYPASSVDVWRSEARISQQVAFAEPLIYQPNDKLWLNLRFVDKPSFGSHPATGEPGVLAVTFKLLGRLLSQQRTETPTIQGDVTGGLAAITNQLAEQNKQIAQLMAAVASGGAAPVVLPASSQQVWTRVSSSRPAFGEQDARPEELERDVPVAEPPTTDTTDMEAPIDEVRFRGLKGDER